MSLSLRGQAAKITTTTSNTLSQEANTDGGKCKKTTQATSTQAHLQETVMETPGAMKNVTSAQNTRSHKSVKNVSLDTVNHTRSQPVVPLPSPSKFPEESRCWTATWLHEKKRHTDLRFAVTIPPRSGGATIYIPDFSSPQRLRNQLISTSVFSKRAAQKSLFLGTDCALSHDHHCLNNFRISLTSGPSFDQLNFSQKQKAHKQNEGKRHKM